MCVHISLSPAGHGKFLVVVAVSARCRRGSRVSVTDGKLWEHQGLPALLPTGNLST